VSSESCSECDGYEVVIGWDGEEVRCTACSLRAEVERLRAAIDAFVTEVDGDHHPEWASEQAKANGKEPWCCAHCGPQDGSWPCTHRMALDELKEARK